jgi:hypothetical protein
MPCSRDGHAIRGVQPHRIDFADAEGLIPRRDPERIARELLVIERANGLRPARTLPRTRPCGGHSSQTWFVQEFIVAQVTPLA